ncbi:MAG: FAD-binding protein [bacterium]
MEYDVIVVGGGLAGCAAALSAKRRLERVLLINDKPGATRMSTGMFDIDPDPAKPRAAEIPDNPSFEANLKALAIANPYHPYSALGGASARESFEDAIHFFMASLAAGGQQAEGGMDRHLLLIGNLGTMKRTRFALPGLAAGDIREPGAMRIAFVGFEGLNEFNAAFVAKSADAAAIRIFGRGFDKVESYEISLQGADGFSNMTPFQIAGLLDQPGYAEKLAEKINSFLPRGEYTHLALPAVMGIERAGDILAILSKALGMEAFEIATVQPSVPGDRLMRALQAALDKAGVETVSGRAAGFTASSGAISSITAELPYGAKQEFQTRGAILASGKFIGGGIKHGAQLQETLFDLPVFVKDKPVRNAVMMDLLTEKIVDRQQLFACGVRIDTSLRPLDEEGNPAFENLMCAGSIIGGYDPMFDRCGAGVSIITGALAGNYIG